MYHLRKAGARRNLDASEEHRVNLYPRTFPHASPHHRDFPRISGEAERNMVGRAGMKPRLSKISHLAPRTDEIKRIEL